MVAIHGSFDNRGAPTVTISISPAEGVASTKQFTAVIDTGFDGFVRMPSDQAETLGLTPNTASEMENADGTVDVVALASARVTVGGDSREGLIHLQHAVDEVLVGLDFLRAFRKVLVLSVAENRVLLLDNLSDIAE
jgi:clan AA aspartic protease